MIPHILLCRNEDRRTCHVADAPTVLLLFRQIPICPCGRACDIGKRHRGVMLGTWEENAAQFAAGQTVAGIIRSVEHYGVFIELTPNLAGLAEIREENRAKIDLTVGYGATVYIKSIIPERMKIKLVLIDTYRTERQPRELNYYVDVAHVKHMNTWRYSPLCAGKLVESVFEKE